ncbi:MAG: fucose isomerase [Theionarchaea archaeon]|nr:fucose isomerase [Theionarchaea archaeon]
MKTARTTEILAVVVGNREYFPDQLAEEGGKDVIRTLTDLGFTIITNFSEETGTGSVQTWNDSKACSQILKENADKIDGVVVTLPNFGDEKGIAETLKLSSLPVPVLVHGFPDESEKMDRAHRRDSFCGKISVCNNLYQYGIPFTNTRFHVEAPDSQEFQEDVIHFGKVCRTVKGLRNARLGAIGVRPNAFKTVRYSEKLLENNGIALEVVNLMEIVGRARELEDTSPEVRKILTQMKQLFALENVPPGPITKTARLTAVILEWVQELELDAVSFNCWPAIEKYYEIVPCAAMAMCSDFSVPAACETDVMGSLSMYALQLASGRPAALADFNNNYKNDLDKCVLFHCSAFAPHFFEERPEVVCHEMQGCYGSLSGKMKAGPVTLFRVETDDIKGKIKGYVAEGVITDDEVETFGSYGVLEVNELQSLLHYVTGHGFAHHVALVRDHVASVIQEAASTYLGWEIFTHGTTGRTGPGD